MTATVQPTAYAIGVTYVIEADSADEAMDLAATAFGHDDRFATASGPYLVGDAKLVNLAAPVVNYGEDWSGDRPPGLPRADDIDEGDDAIVTCEDDCTHPDLDHRSRGDPCRKEASQ